MIEYTVAKTNMDLEQILRLQKANLTANISEEESKKEGFVTLSHDFQLIEELNQPYPHIIATDRSVVVGYALVTTIDKVAQIPLLQKTIDELLNVAFHGQKVLDLRFFIMGQVCIDKQYRGQGLFSGLYKKMKSEMSQYFDLIITEIATHNYRSIRAHEKVGFEILKLHKENGKEWAIVGLWL